MRLVSVLSAATVTTELMMASGMSMSTTQLRTRTGTLGLRLFFVIVYTLAFVVPCLLAKMNS